MGTHTYFIGYDAREHEAAAVAAYSISRRSNVRARIYLIEHMTMRRLGFFDRPWSVGHNGQFYDIRDERPFSTAFSHSRFLAFYLARALKCTGPCMFVDCDWLFLDDPSRILREQKDHPKKIGVVAREREIKKHSVKMDGMIQQGYERKLWSAMFTFMPHEHYAELFSLDKVNHSPGRDLHGFLGAPIGAFWGIDPRWHYIPSLDEKPKDTGGIHFSEFSPWLNPDRRADSPDEFDLWIEEYQAWLHYAYASGGKPIWRNLELDIAAARA